jgi:prepilin-type processing-associated H-X9-DG protein
MITVPVPAYGGMSAPAPHAPSSSSGGGSVLVILAVIGGVMLLGLLACGGLGFALFLPAVQSARVAAERAGSSNNLKQIALAMHNYHDMYGSLPPAYTVDADGNKLHSWRTLLLPYMEQQHIYNQIKLDEPWNSPANIGVSSNTIYGYNRDGFGTYTDYVLVTGPDTLFEEGKAIRFADVFDGTSNSILIVEVVNSEINWMEPRDLTVDEFLADVAGGVTPFPGGRNVAMADGSVRFLSTSLPADQLRNLVTRNDGVPVMLP